VSRLLLTTTQSIEGYEIVEYKGVVHAQVALGVNVIKDFFSGVRGFVGGRMGAIEEELTMGFEQCDNELREEGSRLGGNAVIAVEYDSNVEGESNKILMITASGTAVVLAKRR